MNIFNTNPWSKRTTHWAVVLLIIQIPASRYLFAFFLQESLWHFHLVFTFLAIALLLSYQYGFRGGILSSLLSTVVVAAVELAHFGANNQHLDVHLTVTVAIATLATGIAASVAVGLLAHILQAQRKWLEALFASASDGIVVITRDRRVLAMNAAANQITGWTEDALTAAGGCTALFQCGGDQYKCQGNTSACPVSLAGNPNPNVETEIFHRNGSLVPVSLSSASVDLPLPVWRRASSSAVVLTMRDIATARQLQSELEGLTKLCTDISSLANLTQILQEIASRAGSILSADLVMIALTDGQEHDLTVQHAIGRGAESVTGLRFSSGEGVLGRAYRVGTPIVLRHPTDDPGYTSERDPLVQATNLVSQAAVAFSGRDRAPGVIGVGWYQPRTVLPNQVTVLRQLANLAGVASENSLLLSRIQRRRHEAEALYRLGLEISSLSDFDRKLEFVLEQTRLLVAADVTALWETGEGDNQGTWTVVSAPEPEAARAWLSRSGQGLVAEAAQAGRVLKVEHLTAPDGFRSPGEDSEACEQFRSAVALPLRVRGKTTGALFAGYRSGPRVDEDALLLLSGLSNQLSVALDNARLYSRVQELAVIEERNRLSREIHDGLAQLLSVLNLRAEALKKGLGRLHQAHVKGSVNSDQLYGDINRELEEFQTILDGAYSEVRHSIWTLRHPQQSEQDLASLLHGFAEQFRRYTGISVALHSDCPTPLRLPLSVELQVMRIVQESLNNVRKHSGVKTAAISIHSQGEVLVLQVRDQGRGFHLDLVTNSGKGTYGLSSMHERAAAIGAELSVHSHPGAGTTVTLSIALDRLSA